MIKRFLTTAIWGVIMASTNVQAVEEASYRVLEKEGKFEVRMYDPMVLAETLVEGSIKEAGNRGFGPLFGYISGKGRSGDKIAMTAPVVQEPKDDRWAVSFVMPSGSTMEDLPAPAGKNVTLREVPARKMAAVRYSGTWSETGFLKHKADLEQWLASRGIKAEGEAIWARYNAPFTPWFLRRNEVLIPVSP